MEKPNINSKISYVDRIARLSIKDKNTMHNVVKRLDKSHLFPTVTESRLAELSNALQKLMANDEYDDEIVGEAGFIAYALFVVSLINNSDPKIKNFLRKANSTIDDFVLFQNLQNQGRIEFWSLIIPGKYQLAKHITNEKTEQNILLRSLCITESAEYLQLKEIINEYYLLEIINPETDDIYYAYCKISDIQSVNRSADNPNNLNKTNKSKYIVYDNSAIKINVDTHNKVLKTLDLLETQQVNNAQKEIDIATDVLVQLVLICGSFTRLFRFDLINYLDRKNTLPLTSKIKLTNSHKN